MADTFVQLNANTTTGSKIAVDQDAGGEDHQYVKVEFGGSATQTQVTSSVGLPVDILAGTAEIGNVKNSGTFAVQSTLQAGTAEVGNVKNSGTFVTQATLQTSTAEIGNVKNSGTFATQATLQAGTAEIGKLAAGVASIGTVVLGAGTAEVGKLAAGTAEVGNVKNSGTFATQATLQAGTAEIGKLAAGTAAIGKLAANSGVDIGDVDVTSISAGTSLVGDVGLSGARTSGGTTLYKNIDVDQTEDQIKATAGQVYWIHAMNLKASVLYLKFYNATAANVTVGTTVPDLTYPIPTQGDTNGAGFTLSVPNGMEFSTAITIACTTGIADNDAGAPGANECVVNLGYA